MVIVLNALLVLEGSVSISANLGVKSWFSFERSHLC